MAKKAAPKKAAAPKELTKKQLAEIEMQVAEKTKGISNGILRKKEADRLTEALKQEALK